MNLEHEIIITGEEPQDFIVLKPYTYALINDPVIRGEKGDILLDPHGQVKVRYGEQEIRTDAQYPEPFPLYPGETLKKIDRLTAIPRDCALKVRANRDFIDKTSAKRQAGDEWQIKGPHIYVPRIEEDKVQLQEPIILDINKAIKIRAKYQCVDGEGKFRQAGEEWLIRRPGQYMLGVHEVLVEIVNGIVLTDKKAIHLTATRTFKDVYGVERRAGEEWLVTKATTSVHICDVNEKIVAEISVTVLRSDEHCYLLNPRKGNENEMGKKILIKGPKIFFLQPGEVLESGIKRNYILGDDEALLLTAIEDFQETVKEKTVKHVSGERWMIYGPCSYVPSVEVSILETRKAIPMDQVEGIYVRDCKSGTVRAVIGKTYMLTENEELAAKMCPDVVLELLKKQNHVERKEHFRLVTFKCPFNAAVQIYDYKTKSNRVEFGPTLVMLAPDEQFTVTYLSGSTPKVPGRVSTLYLLLGPTFSTDVAEVETSDHARLEIKLSYNWRFIVDPKNKGHMYNVRDFIGDMCKAMASRVRSAVATVPFDQFHRSSVSAIRKAIFGVNPETKALNKSLFFDNNGLEIFNVDIQNIEPKDKKTKESLDKTVTQAIQITTKIQEQDARRIADKCEQEEKGKLDCLILDNKAVVEKAKEGLLKLKADSDTIKSKGQAIADARAKAEAAEITAKAEVTAANLRALAKKTREMSQIEYEKAKNLIEYNHLKAVNEQKVNKGKALAAIEADKFKAIMTAIGQDTLIQIAMSGPEMQAKMLGALGLQGYMIMGSTNPINLFTAANGMIKSDEKKE